MFTFDTFLKAVTDLPSRNSFYSFLYILQYLTHSNIVKVYFDFHLLCQQRWQFNKVYLFTLFIGICVSRVTVFKIGKTWTWSSLQYNLKSFLSYTWSFARWVLLWPLRTSIIKRNLLCFALQLAKVIADWPLWCFYLPFLLYCPLSLLSSF